MPYFTSEIAQLRALGFAEALPIGDSSSTPDAVARLESGRHGLAVEFFEADAKATYSVVSLEQQEDHGTACNMWSDVMHNVRRRAPPTDND